MDEDTVATGCGRHCLPSLRDWFNVESIFFYTFKFISFVTFTFYPESTGLLMLSLEGMK